MRPTALSKHSWSPLLGLLLCFAFVGPARAAPGPSVQLAIGSPLPNSLIAGRVTVSVAYNAGMNRINAFTLFVDDSIHLSRPFMGMSTRGVYYIVLDTRTLPDGNHTLRISATGSRGLLGSDSVDVTIRNGVTGAPDAVPPLVQFRNLADGDTVSGRVSVDVLAEDNTTMDLLVSVFINRLPRLLKSSPPYLLDFDTAEFLDPATNTGKVMLEAWAFDKQNNLGKARPITLNVVPAGSNGNLTRKLPDPISSRPMAPEAALRNDPEPLKTPSGSTLVFPLDPRGTTPPDAVPTPKVKLSAPAGSRPSAPRMAKSRFNVSDPDFAPVGGSGRGAVLGSRDAIPYRGARPSARPTGRTFEGPAPELIDGPTPIPALGSARLTRPAPGSPAQSALLSSGTVDPQLPSLARAASPGSGTFSSSPGRERTPPSPAVTASANFPAEISSVGEKPAASVGIRVPLPAPVRTARAPAVEPASSRIPIIRPEINGAGLSGGASVTARTARIPGSAPMLSPSGPRDMVPPPAPARIEVTVPSVKVATAKIDPPRPQPDVRPSTEGPIIVLVDPQAKPDKSGRKPAQVFRLNRPAAPKLPTDRRYRVHSRDTLQSIARKFKVTPKSLLVANGLTEARGVRSGSIIRVPGTYDVVLNDRRVAFDVTPRVENGLALTPFRQIFEHAGGVVVWYPDSREVRAANDLREVKLQIGSKEAKVNQAVVIMDRAAFLDSGRTIVPLSFMERALDLVAEYDPKNGTVLLVRK